MVRGLQSSADEELGWLGEFSKGGITSNGPPLIIMTSFPSIDFRKRFLKLLSFNFREFSSVMGLSVLEAANAGVKYSKSDKMPGYIISIDFAHSSYTVHLSTDL
jgi:N-acetyltransferase 10